MFLGKWKSHVHCILKSPTRSALIATAKRCCPLRLQNSIFSLLFSLNLQYISDEQIQEREKYNLYTVPSALETKDDLVVCPFSTPKCFSIDIVCQVFYNICNDIVYIVRLYIYILTKAEIYTHMCYDHYGKLRLGFTNWMKPISWLLTLKMICTSLT